MSDEKLYNLVIARKITLVTTIQIEGTSKESAVARFQHQLESGECSALGGLDLDYSMYCQFGEPNPIEDEYEVIEIEEQPNE